MNEPLDVGDLWSGDVFGDGQRVGDDDLDSVVMLQRAAAATFVMDEMKRSGESAAAGRVGIEMELPDSPRYESFDSDNDNVDGDAAVTCNWKCGHYDGNCFGAATGAFESSTTMIMHIASVNQGLYVCCDSVTTEKAVLWLLL
jgi:hypothetical protein